MAKSRAECWKTVYPKDYAEVIEIGRLQGIEEGKRLAAASATAPAAVPHTALAAAAASSTGTTTTVSSKPAPASYLSIPEAKAVIEANPGLSAGELAVKILDAQQHKAEHDAGIIKVAADQVNSKNVRAPIHAEKPEDAAIIDKAVGSVNKSRK